MNTFIYISILSLTLFACSKESSKEHDHAAEEKSNHKYTCPMHPQVIRDAAAQCAICGMDLVPINKGNANSNDLMLSENQIKLANITTQRVSVRSIGETVTVNARLVANEERTEIISSRAAGRIEKLFVKETGRTIQKGEPLYELYSEMLLTLQKEYLLAKQQFETLGTTEKRFETFLKAAKGKLLLYGLSQNQINKLADTKNVQTRITFLASASGVVTKISVAEGQYVEEGSSLLKLEDVSSLWLEAELYPSETSLVKIGDKINVSVSGLENTPLEVKVIFLSPEYRSSTQIVVMRAAIDNRSMNLKPGMQAQVFFTHSSKQAIAIPVDAVIHDGDVTHVYVQNGRNVFKPKMVKTGIEDFNKVEITEGLTEQDTVVVSGAYLLYSEIVLKKGHNPMAAHNHTEMQMTVKQLKKTNQK